jgi:hypothetical protein
VQKTGSLAEKEREKTRAREEWKAEWGCFDFIYCFVLLREI